jgi:hypothetical protein
VRVTLKKLLHTAAEHYDWFDSFKERDDYYSFLCGFEYALTLVMTDSEMPTMEDVVELKEDREGRIDFGDLPPSPTR